MGVAQHDERFMVYDPDWTADDLSATGDAGYIFDIVQPITVTRIGALVTTILSGPAVINFDRRVLTGSDSGRLSGFDDADEATLTIPTTTAVGKIVYKNVSGEDYDMDPGDQIVPNVSTGATSGACRYIVWYVPRDETVDNCTDMVESS
jgi:hypothetical protein